jgi:hypothetical protein
MNEPIKNIELSFSCSENWDAMLQANGGRHCDKCQKKVHDFTNSKADEFRKVLAESGNSVCGRFTSEQMAAEPAAFPLWKRWVSAALVIMGFNFLGRDAIAQHAKHKQIKQKVKITPMTTMGDIQVTKYPKVFHNTDSLNNIKLEEKTIQEPDTAKYIFGTVSEVPPEFPGGYEKLTAFINKNLNQSKSSKPGRVNVTFVVEKDGTLSDIIAIGRIFDQNATDEAIRVMKLSPKWIPGKQNGKPVRVQYTVPIVFN